MYKVILASVVAIGVLFPTTSASAKPTDTEQTEQVKKKPVKKKRLKKGAWPIKSTTKLMAFISPSVLKWNRKKLAI